MKVEKLKRHMSRANRKSVADLCKSRTSLLQKKYKHRGMSDLQGSTSKVQIHDQSITKIIDNEVSNANLTIKKNSYSTVKNSPKRDSKMNKSMSSTNKASK